MADDADYLMMMEALAGDFLDESSDKLETVEECLSNIENGIGRAPDNLLVIKREVHSIKGGGTPFGFPTISRLCHGLEDYLETTSDQQNVSIEDIVVFIEGMKSIILDRAEPDKKEQEMLLKSLPTGRKQSGQMAITRGVGLLIMPKGLQRKIVGQELAQLGFKLTLESNPISAIDIALVLNPDFIIVSMVNDKLSGIEISNMFHAAEALRHTPFAVLTSSDLDELDKCPKSTTFINKGPTFSRDLMGFIGFATSQQPTAALH